MHLSSTFDVQQSKRFIIGPSYMRDVLCLQSVIELPILKLLSTEVIDLDEGAEALIVTLRFVRQCEKGVTRAETQVGRLASGET